MLSPKEISSISPLPFINLDEEIEEPYDGVFLGLSKTCKNHFKKDSKCKEHYARFKDAVDDFSICPHGFCSKKFKCNGSLIALTGFIPFPRNGGKAQRELAKRENKHKISVDSLERSITLFSSAQNHLKKLENLALQNYANALHEIKKLNRTIKQESERICQKEFPNDPDKAAQEFVTIWKTSEIMSQQFDIIEILANETLTDLPITGYSEIYKLFDKCVRIHKHRRDNIKIKSPHEDYHPRIKVCDKTISIIPTVLLTNALKYSIPDSPVHVVFEDCSNFCRVTVKNVCQGKIDLDDSIYEKGKRKARDNDGSGYGLYIAQKIAAQHNAKITHTTTPMRKSGITEVRFIVEFKVI